MTADDTLLPPFPPFAWDDYWWAGYVHLPAWTGLRPLRGAGPPDGTVEIHVNTENDEPAPPGPAQAAAFEYLLDQQAAIRDAILRAVFAEYSANYLTWREEYGYDKGEAEEHLPVLKHPEDLKRLISLTGLNIFPTAHGGLSYVGYEFACTWDAEHALGAMTHGRRVVAVGGADTAILEWIAAQDAEGRPG